MMRDLQCIRAKVNRHKLQREVDTCPHWLRLFLAHHEERYGSVLAHLYHEAGELFAM